MKRIALSFRNAVEDRRATLTRFFVPNQYVVFTHWAKNVWINILRASLFGEISENVAVDIIGHEMIGPCTMVIVYDHFHTWLMIADKVGVSKIDLLALNALQLERLGGLLHGRIYPADMYPNDKVKARQELLQGEIEAMDDGSTSFYLAGL
jgi:hypothetical protein